MSYGARIPFGEREGTLYRTHEVDNGLACECLCPDCRHPLIAANRGTKVIPYFRHAAAITGALKQGESVTLVGFGTFEEKQRAAREGRNPQTGTTLQIAASKLPGFKSGKGLKDALN